MALQILASIPAAKRKDGYTYNGISDSVHARVGLGLLMLSQLIKLMISRLLLQDLHVVPPLVVYAELVNGYM